MTITGDWDVRIKTPIGSLEVRYTFTEHDGALRGSAAGKHETVTLSDIVVDGEHVTWRQSITKPMRLHLEFDVHLDGDRFAGHSRAGRLPSSAVCGVRRG
ncbi:hypothetical protein V4U86_23475 [Mycobacterium sp. AMU20-3851]|uniref:hypothetical protein n=1 Tax=Mycobacterium sp. AMU20-3851 TaxID=3122055 RepID=UPI003754DE4A